MRIVVQRVSSASVTIDGAVKGAIERGLLLLIGIGPLDTEEDGAWLAGKIATMRLFPDADGKMNMSVRDVEGGILAISQFTLFASTRKGTRPSFNDAAPPDLAKRLYSNLLVQLGVALGKPVAAGEFGADMKVSLLNDGPVTILLDSKSRE